MRSAPRMLVVVVMALGLAACSKATEQECEAACLHYSKLGLAQEQSLELDSEELEQAWQAMREREELEQGLIHCTQMCRGQASSGQTACILEAESIEAADTCAGVSRAKTVGEN